MSVYSPRGVTILSLLSSTVLFTMIWLPTNYMYSHALLTIPPIDVTALFSTAPVFVFLLSIVILREPSLVLRVSTVCARTHVHVYLFLNNMHVQFTHVCDSAHTVTEVSLLLASKI